MVTIVELIFLFGVVFLIFTNARKRQGYRYLLKGKWKPAVNWFSAKIQREPQNAQLYFCRAMAYSQLGNNEAVLADLEQVITLNPNWAEAVNNRGATYMALGKFDNAFDDFDRAISLNPQYADAYANRGIISRRRGEAELALADFNRALQLNPRSSVAYLNRGKIYFDRGQFQQAIDNFKNVKDTGTLLTESLVGEAISYRALGQRELAYKIWNSVPNRDANYRNPEWLKNKVGWPESMTTAVQSLAAEV